jgi:hypothetical protein
MAEITAKDGTKLYYKDWGSGRRTSSRSIRAPLTACAVPTKDQINADLLAFFKE